MDPPSTHEEGGEESGWTSILCESPGFHDDHAKDNNDDDGSSHDDYDVDDEDDGSLASDASSGGYKDWQNPGREDDQVGGNGDIDRRSDEDRKYDNECYESCSNDDYEQKAGELHGEEGNDDSSSVAKGRARQQTDSGGDSTAGFRSNSSAISFEYSSIKG